jgi:multiple sugar transport system substrate-binding protein
VNVLAYNSSAVDPFTNTMVNSCTRENTPYAAAADQAIANIPAPQPYPYVPAISGDITPVVAKVVTGGQSIEDGTQEMQEIAEGILAKQ